MEPLQEARMASLLQESIAVTYRNRQVAINDQWLQRVWDYLRCTDLTQFSSVPLLPVKTSNHYVLREFSTGLFICKSAWGAHLSEDLASALILLGVTVLTSLPEYVMEHRQVMPTYVQPPTDEGVASVLSRVDQSSATKAFNKAASSKEKVAMVQLICKTAAPLHVSLYRGLKLFTSTDRGPASVEECPYIAPPDLPPVLPVILLACTNSESKAARHLGAREVSSQKLVIDVLKKMTPQTYGRDKISALLQYVMHSRELMKDPQICKLARDVAFVETESGDFRKPKDLYNPTPNLCTLLHFQRNKLFPHSQWAQPDILKKLKKLGLRDEVEVQEADLINAASSVQAAWNAWSWNSQGQQAAMMTAESLWQYLVQYGSNISQDCCRKLASIQCLPCLQEKPQGYPSSLPLVCTPKLVKPVEMTTDDLVYVTGSVTAIAKPGLAKEVAQDLGIQVVAQLDPVLRHLDNVTQCYTKKEATKFKTQLQTIFERLAEINRRSVYDRSVINSLCERSCMLVDSEDTFVQPSRLCLARDASNVDLRPFRFFSIQLDTEEARGLLHECGSASTQDDDMLHSVLAEISEKYHGCRSAHPDYSTDLRLVKRILDKIWDGGDGRGGTTLLPVVASIAGVLNFALAQDCTVAPASMARNNAGAGNETYHFVLHDIDTQLALDLGALNMPARALTGLEDLDYEYDDYEQCEKLTYRLHGLLNEAYTDGFSVPKELVQNADDAGASKVYFLLDERENRDARSSLICDKMESLQGPAIWTYNDAEFSNDDFQNIIRFGAGTKKEDASKVGRFGLGFSAVYNLTEVPCFFSRHWLAMFDPQHKFLHNGNGGMKLDFRKPINKDLLSRYSDQFKPFNNVFGCQLQSGAPVDFHGTLFRFPLRTAQQAETSELKQENYSSGKQKEFLKMLLERAGSVLMFTQNVQEICVYHLPHNSNDPSSMKCLLKVRKKDCPPVQVLFPQRMQLDGIVVKNGKETKVTVLDYFKENWGRNNRAILMSHQFRIKHNVSKDAREVCGVEESCSETRWQLAWASGTDKSADLALRYWRQEGLVPVAAVAVSLSERGLQALAEGPPGFYKKGHLFCFLPLPEETSRVELPVHVNGMFALTSDRRGLRLQTEDDLDDRESVWNTALYGDAICQAYFLLLTLVRSQVQQNSDFDNYFSLWPAADCIPALVTSFYQRMQDGADCTIFPVPTSASSGNINWISFRDAWFLDPAFRNSACGQFAWEALQTFWKGPGSLVDIPSNICQLIEKGCGQAYKDKVITELQFYQIVFFPNLKGDWWLAEHRDSLVHHALMNKSKDIQELVKSYACIPCQGSTQLRPPDQLVSPDGKVAALFLMAEGRFPQTVDKRDKGNQTPQKIDFCDHATRQRLSSLGMITSVMPWSWVVERAQSVQKLVHDGQEDEAIKRASRLIGYLAENCDSVLGGCTQDERNSLAHIDFLPVLQRPSDWPFRWAGDGHRLAKPLDLASRDLQNLVACSSKLLDSEALELTGAAGIGKPKAVLEWLGVVVEQEHNMDTQMMLAMQQLLEVSDHGGRYPTNQDQLRTISSEVYKYLTACLNKDTSEVVMNEINSHLSNKKIVWIGSSFALPSVVAFSSNDCSPHLFQLEKSLQTKVFKAFFEAVGVKDTFKVDDVLLVLEKLKEENSDEMLSENSLRIVKQLADLLADVAKRSPLSTEDQNRVFLPDSEGILRNACTLCIDDCTWLTGLTVHNVISKDVAKLLGVTTKKKQHFASTRPILPKAFGQKEKLTTRIKRLLDGYTFDSSLFMELLQNADDAGATECKLIMDFRRLGTETIPENWEALQGPALCFYNNKSFTSGDIRGIQNLGEGSKGDNALKTGQFGVGFNAVFHITDVPSFWTRVDDAEETICIFDPNGCYVPVTEPGALGAQFPGDLIPCYPDMLSGYLPSLINVDQPGTLFRFPLRTERMAEKSDIRKDVVTELHIKELLGGFRSEMAECLLFLNNLRSVGIYTVSEDGVFQEDFESKFEVSKTLDDYSMQCMNRFSYSLELASEALKQHNMSLSNIPTHEEVVQCKLTDSTGREENWLTVHRVGFENAEDLPQELSDSWNDILKLLPRGGVAVQLREEPEGRNHARLSKIRDHKLFCILPLPVNTSLPMHVNGHFSLDHETRRDLWGSKNKKEDTRSKWNDAVALHIIVPAYVTALLFVRDTLPPCSGESSQEQVRGLGNFHQLFPAPGRAPTDFWKNVVLHLYRTLAKKESPVFPVLDSGQGIEWIPAVKQGGFPGYFDNLESYFGPEQQATRPAYRSAGTSSSTNAPGIPTPDARIKKMKTLLKNMNMKVLESPFCIHEYFKESGINVDATTPTNVLNFLRSTEQYVTGGCNIINLPKPVSETSLKTVEDTRMLIAFVSREPDFFTLLVNLPLCLRESGVLYTFCDDADDSNKPIMSEFSHLLPASAGEFLHKEILTFFKCNEQSKTVLRQFTIPMLAERLPLSLTDPRFCADLPCPLDLESLPCKNWLKDLWKFFEEQFSEKSNTGTEEQDTVSTDTGDSIGGTVTGTKEQYRQQAPEKFQCLQNWCLVPVIESQRCMLYPIQHLQKVVYLPANTSDLSNAALWRILKTLPLPFLDGTLLCYNSLSQNLAASITYPRALLHALASCADQLSASHQDGRVILEYFNSNLSNLESSCTDKSELKREMRDLPVFPSICGQLVSLDAKDHVICLHKGIPKDGLMQWSRLRPGPTRLLLQGFVPHSLLKYLHFHSVSSEEFYALHLLPTLQPEQDALSSQEILTHVTFLKNINFRWDNEHSEDLDTTSRQLFRALKHAAFIHVHGQYCSADNFYSPHNDVLRLMRPEQFPPEPFSNWEWKEFMMAAGMVSKVSTDMFLTFAKELESEGQQGLSNQTREKSKVLVSHLFNRRLQQEQDLLRGLQQIRFLLPFDWESHPSHMHLATIAAPYSSPRLVSFAESCSEKDIHLVWSSSCIIHPDGDPRMTCHANMLPNFGIQDHVLKEKVLSHSVNVTQAIGTNGDAVFDNPSTQKVLVEVMEHLYDYFLKSMDDGMKSVLMNLAFVCDVENHQMLKPSQVVISLNDEDVIRGHIEKAPLRFGKYFDLFENLGSKKKVSANHFALVLEWLNNELDESDNDRQLHPNELKLAISAISGMFRCLKGRDAESKNVSVRRLFMLTNEHNERSLRLSTAVVVKDSGVVERISDPPDGTYYFVGFDKLGIEVLVPRDAVNLLPEQHRMLMLSDLVKEVVPEELCQAASEGPMSFELEERLHHPFVTQAIVSLVYDMNYAKVQRPFPVEEAHSIRDKLSYIELKEVINLHTVLRVNGTTMQGSERPKLSFTDKIRSQAGPRRAVVYVDADARGRSDHFIKRLVHSLCLAVMFVIGVPVNEHHLNEVLSNPHQAKTILKEYDIAKCSFADEVENSILPVLGTFIPPHYHCFLDNSFCRIDKDDYVGVEVFDPQLNESASRADPDLETADPVFVYGKMVGKGESWNDVPNWQRTYKINLGPDQGISDINITKVYKFVRRRTQQRGGMVVHVEQQTADSGQVPRDLQATLREIRKQLREAWQQLADPRDRRRIFKRLLLQYHPDKNIGNEEFCNRITQKILEYFDLLSEGMQLPEDENDDEVDGTTYSPRSTFSSAFYGHMNARAHRYRADFESAPSSARRPNPQPHEGRRWMRQAQADITAAEKARGTSDKGRNWICYMCHQAAEKALKGVLYAKDNSCSFQSHNLTSLAYSVDDTTIFSLAQELENTVGPHVRMRYPDALAYPRIPSDVFDDHHVDVAYGLAAQIVARAEVML